MRTAFVSSYLPQRSGIAEFSAALGSAVGERVVVALQPLDQELPFPFEVAHRVRRDEVDQYVHTAGRLNAKVDVVSIQHDFTSWGGETGRHVLEFVDALDVPAVTTLHTVPGDPSAEERELLSALVARSAATVVMCPSAVEQLGAAYPETRQSRVEVIAHGVPDLPLLDADTIKPSLALKGRELIVSFGLLRPGKGYELAIDAMQAVVKAHPTATYAILGATRTDLIRRDGEGYRNSLIARAARLGLSDHVRFADHYLGRTELSRWLEAADIVLTPYPDLDRVVSGTLSFGLGAGRAVVSTPYPYARDLLANGRGVVVPAPTPSAIAAALIALLDNPARRAEIGSLAYERGRTMVWPKIGAEYRRLFESVLAASPVPSLEVIPAIARR